MSCCNGGGCGGGGCGGGGCGGGGCGGGGCCGGGGGHGCGGCPKRPVALLAFNREGTIKLLDGAKSAGKDNLLLTRTSKGLELSLEGDSSIAPVVAEEIEFEGPMSPLYGWDYKDATKKPCTEHFEEGNTAHVLTVLFADELEESFAPNPLFFGLTRAALKGCMGDFGLVGVPCTRLPDDAYEAKRTPSEGDAKLPEGNIVPSVLLRGFNVDPIAFGCAEIHKGMDFLYTSLAPKAGMNVFLHFNTAERYSTNGYVRMLGTITEVGELPALYDSEIEKEIGESFFKHCDCGKTHTVEDILKEVGTIHGQRIKAKAYVTPEQVGTAAKVLCSNQFEVELVAKDPLQMVWQVDKVTVLPKDQWIPVIKRP